MSLAFALSLSLSLSLAGGNIVALLAGMFVCFSTDSTVYISVNIYSVMFVTYLRMLFSQNSRHLCGMFSVHMYRMRVKHIHSQPEMLAFIFLNTIDYVHLLGRYISVYGP